MILEIIFWAIGLYILYKLVFDFILPVARTTNNVRKQFRSMQDQMNDNYQQYNTTTQTSDSAPYNRSNVQERHSNPVGNKEDYIDFEEIK